jgi:hypothetical protein
LTLENSCKKVQLKKFYYFLVSCICLYLFKGNFYSIFMPQHHQNHYRRRTPRTPPPPAQNHRRRRTTRTPLPHAQNPTAAARLDLAAAARPDPAAAVPP